MSYTLRGRLETRLAAALAPLAAACALALVLATWWPVQVAVLMLAVGVVLDVVVYHRLLPYQPGWAALPLGLVELAAVTGLARALEVAAPLAAAIAFFAGAWLLTQALVHAGLPLAVLAYGDDGGELGRAGLAVAGAVAVLLAGTGGTAWALQPPTVRLTAGVHEGPLVLDRAQTLVGAPGAVVRGGIVVTADDVTVRSVAVVGGEHGIEVDGAVGVVLDRVSVSGAALDGIHVRRASVEIRDCRVRSSGRYAQGIDISFAFDLEPSTVEACEVVGGQEGIVSHFAHVAFRDNAVRATALRGITVTEMSMGTVTGNSVRDALGVGIFCGDYSVCEIEDNSVVGTLPDRASGDRTRMGFGIVAHFGAEAILAGNHLRANERDVATFLDARTSSG